MIIGSIQITFSSPVDRNIPNVGGIQYIKPSLSTQTRNCDVIIAVLLLYIHHPSYIPFGPGCALD